MKVYTILNIQKKATLLDINLITVERFKHKIMQLKNIH